MENKKSPKQTIIWRKDLNCRTGKIASQIAHASMKVFLDRRNIREGFSNPQTAGYYIPMTPEMVEWVEGQFTKVVLGCKSLAEIYELESKAKELNIPYAIVTDSGKTEFHGVPTVTCIAIGPAKAEDVESITKQFPLM